MPGSAPSQRAFLVAFRHGLQRQCLRHPHVITTQSAGAGSSRQHRQLHRPSHGAAARPRPRHRHPASRSHQANASHPSRFNPARASPSLPPPYTLAANHRVTLSVTENGTSGDSLAWSVNGIAGGNSSPRPNLRGRFFAVPEPSSGSAARRWTISPRAPCLRRILFPCRVASTGNPAFAASSQITVINHVFVRVLPNSVTLPPLGVQGFTATVLGTTNQGVIWQVQGAASGSFRRLRLYHPGGAFTAPSVPPSRFHPDPRPQPGRLHTIRLAAVTISTGANILTLHPASVYAGAADGFTLSVSGSGFVPSNPGPGSTLKIAGTARVTTCDQRQLLLRACHQHRRRASRQRNASKSRIQTALPPMSYPSSWLRQASRTRLSP